MLLLCSYCVCSDSNWVIKTANNRFCCIYHTHADSHFFSLAYTNKQQEFCYCEIHKWMSKHVFVKWYHDQVIKLIQLELQILFTHSIRLAVGSILHAGGQKEIADERRPIICLYICAHCSTELHRLVLWAIRATTLWSAFLFLQNKTAHARLFTLGNSLQNVHCNFLLWSPCLSNPPVGTLSGRSFSLWQMHALWMCTGGEQPSSVQASHCAGSDVTPKAKMHMRSALALQPPGQPINRSHCARTSE